MLLDLNVGKIIAFETVYFTENEKIYFFNNKPTSRPPVGTVQPLLSIEISHQLQIG